MTGVTAVAVGNALIDHTYHLTNLPEPDGGAFVEKYERRLGGVATNVAAILAHLDHDTSLVSSVGNDEDGDEILERLEDTAIAETLVHRADDRRSSYTLVLTDPDGQRAIIGGGESVFDLTLSEQDVAAVAAADVAFTSAYVPLSVVETLLDIETPLVYDLAGKFTDLVDRGLTRAELDAIAADIDFFVSNLASVQSYLETEADPSACRSMLQTRGITTGVITLGTDGAYLFDADRDARVPTFDVSVTDTTGAGDAFTAGLIHAWFDQGTDLADAGRFASAVAALNCTTTGAHVGAPTLAEVNAFLER